MTEVATPIPDLSSPVIDIRTGMMTPVWVQFFYTLLRRTGGEDGSDSGDLEIRIEDAETRITATELLAFAGIPVGSPPPDLQQEAQKQFLQSFDAFPEQLARPFLAPDPLEVPVFVHGVQNDPDQHAVATQTTAGFMSAADKTALDNFTPAQSTVALVDVNLANTTADGNILSITFAANTLKAGTDILTRLFALVTAVASGGTLSFWMKIGTTKVITQVLTIPASAQTNRGVFGTMTFTCQTVGVSGFMQASALIASDSNALAAGQLISTAPITINTTISNTFTLGWNWSVANAGNSATSKNVGIFVDKS